MTILVLCVLSREGGFVTFASSSVRSLAMNAGALAVHHIGIGEMQGRTSTLPLPRAPLTQP